MKNLGFLTALFFGGLLGLSYIGFHLKYEDNTAIEGQWVYQEMKTLMTDLGETKSAPRTEATGTEAQGAFDEAFPGELSLGSENPGVVTVEEEEMENEDPKKMAIQTRPGLDIINLSFNNDKVEMITMEVYDQSGKKVLSRSTPTQVGKNSYFFNLEYVSSGIYLITASTSDWTNTKKVYKYDLI